MPSDEYELGRYFRISLMRKRVQTSFFAAAVEAAESHRLVEDGDLVAITAGVPLGVSGTTNLMKVEKIGK